MRKLIFLSLLLFISGCAYKPNYGTNLSPSDLENGNSSEALLIIIKHGENATNTYAGSHAVVTVNGKESGGLLEKTYIKRSVPAGENKITVHTPFSERPVGALMLFSEYEIKKYFKGGETYFLHYEIDADPIGKYYGAYEAESVQKFNDINFSEVSSAKAIELMSKSRFLVGLTK